MSVAKSMEIWTIIKFCAIIGKTPTETYKELKRASEISSVSRRLILNGTNGSVEGRESVDDDNRSGRRPSVISAHMTRVVQYICALAEYVSCTLHKNNKNYKILCINHSSVDSKTNYNIKSKCHFTSNKQLIQLQ
jgi:hypothetical protein